MTMIIMDDADADDDDNNDDDNNDDDGQSTGEFTWRGTIHHGKSAGRARCAGTERLAG